MLLDQQYKTGQIYTAIPKTHPKSVPTLAPSGFKPSRGNLSSFFYYISCSTFYQLPVLREKAGCFFHSGTFWVSVLSIPFQLQFRLSQIQTPNHQHEIPSSHNPFPNQRFFRSTNLSNSSISSSSATVSAGFAIQAVVHANLALKSLAPALKN
jgi:hypothetical protein